MSFTVAPIVEGHGDVAAAALLIRRIAPALHVARPVRFPRSRLLIDEHLRRAAHIAAANITSDGAILLLIDADENCAARLGPDLERRLNALLPTHTCRVVLAVREFEAWIVGGDPVYGVPDADAAGGLKDRIRERHGEYRETADQPRLAARIDLQHVTDRSRSFRRLCKVLTEFTAGRIPHP